MSGDNEQSVSISNDGIVALKPEDFEAMLEKAAHRGAKRALEGVGLGDDSAGNDVRDLRSLIKDWRTVRQGMLRALGKLLLWMVFAGAAAFGVKSGILGDWGSKP